ncbi:GDCCVxC domain-containing (seleno)protein [Methylocystis sp. Sn-Cys]|uniref:GDCCVxC domain-containing (seleno)protein n=1 Tax=Methylocystis sp. Sn-Cys TaxID=1701263 RepID=UPI00351C6374
MRLASKLTCPRCGHAETLTMAENACVVVYNCPACGARLTPKEGDCCVFCSYGDVPCPPIQAEQHCCSSPR